MEDKRCDNCKADGAFLIKRRDDGTEDVVCAQCDLVWATLSPLPPATLKYLSKNRQESIQNANS